MNQNIFALAAAFDGIINNKTFSSARLLDLFTKKVFINNFTEDFFLFRKIKSKF